MVWDLCIQSCSKYGISITNNKVVINISVDQCLIVLFKISTDFFVKKQEYYPVEITYFK